MFDVPRKIRKIFESSIISSNKATSVQPSTGADEAWARGAEGVFCGPTDPPGQTSIRVLLFAQTVRKCNDPPTIASL